VGGVVFSDDVIAEVRPQRSRRAVDRLLTAIAEANQGLKAEVGSPEPLSINRVLGTVANIARRDHLVIILSDFDEIDERSRLFLGGLARHNDVVVCLVTDPIAHDIPDRLQLVVTDGVLQVDIDTEAGQVRRALAEMSSGRLAQILEWQRSLGIPVLPLSAGEETLPQIRRLMGFTTRRR
jgi:uncharacterized protein (DUF58 family)